MFVSMLAFRIIVMVIVAVGTGWLAFWHTSDLNEVESKWVYRGFVFVGGFVGVLFVSTRTSRTLFEVFGLFPIE